MMGWGSDMPGWGGHWFGGLFMILFWILIVLGIVYLVRAFASRGGAAGAGKNLPEPPLEILKRRYASGEIDKPEFEEKMKALTE